MTEIIARFLIATYGSLAVLSLTFQIVLWGIRKIFPRPS